MIKRGEFLITIDPKDYDVKAWEKEINVEEQKPFLENLNENIFNKKIK
jgi:multidrug resistance efflux pump